ncbi:MAG: hypothetical protein HYU85_06670 [Chloroflexi bacterium]|nr:hypothetical protein [Chloroflexota bacterium]MBI3040926.1 hypothetical protein [Chloroflexota bacterium]MBI3930628.1 hypothetical protein [Chloroflexota bacterium]
MNIYKALWSKIEGRPWTYILRDWWDDYEFFWIVGLVSLGIWLGHHYGGKSVMIGWLLFTTGYISGHLFWGKDYIPRQKGE